MQVRCYDCGQIFRKVKQLNKMKESVMLAMAVTVIKVVEVLVSEVEKAKGKVIDYAFLVIEKELKIADTDSWL